MNYVYKEDSDSGKAYRQEYIDSVNRLLKKRQAEATELRDRFGSEIVGNPDKARAGLEKMLGWPLNERPYTDIPKAKETLVAREAGLDIIRLQLEIMPDFWYYGILFKRTDGKKHPFFISQHGGGGTPEECSSLLKSGSAIYNGMTGRILKYDASVFAPQMMLWNVEKYGTEYNRTDVDNILKQCGGSVTSLEVYALTRALDYFEEQPFVNGRQIGMAGFSYGGMFTLFTSALDKRIKAGLSCSYFCDRFSDTVRNFTSMIRPDWVYRDSATAFFDAEIAALVRPRKIYLARGKQDEMFDYKGSISEFERLKRLCPDYERWAYLDIFEGVHEFCPTDNLLQKFMSNFDF